MSRERVQRAIGALAILALLLAIAASAPASFGLRSPATTPVAAAKAVGEPVSSGRRWFMATQAALQDARAVRMPFADLGEAAGTGPVAFEFEAYRGQTLELTLQRDDAAPAGAPIFVEVFRVVEVLGDTLHERLAALRPSTSRLRSRLPSDGTYHVLVQAGEQAGGYRLMLELDSALPFPVVGAREDAIRSLFGASRDDGQRPHQGVDIFVNRLTPVLAVAAGRAMPRQDALGGNVVWLNTPGTSYYYAHLDRVAVRDQQAVKAGDVLGYVGNTGNARNMPSHLHFGVYRWGREPIDPLPLLVGQRFDEHKARAAADAGG
jgi:murein DD-endopeptidase MepM/ murein hydrolase activator NlpD